MNFYAFHLALSILFLLACCIFLFVLFRHIEIRKIEFQFSDTQSSTSSRLSRKHSKRDDAIVLLRVLLIVIFLVILMDEDKGTRWIMLVASYVVVTFLSLLFLAKSGNTAPSIRERKWEYLALFSVLVLLTGAAIALVKYSVLMLKYGKEYFGAARIIGYNNESDDDTVEQNGNQKEQNEEKNEEKDQEENNGENNEDNGENRRRLENEKDEGEVSVLLL
jgi:glucan phosphoethanolaminetransferase (alkaline phosphatase superfamily)